MRNIIDNLKRQHRDLTRVTMEIVPRLDAAPLDAAVVRRNLNSLTGILKIHVAMEDRSFYPYLLAHRDEELRKLALEFLAQRDEIQQRYQAFADRWLELGAIERAPAAFVEETREMLLELGTRMVEEDKEFHPLILKRSQDS